MVFTDAENAVLDSGITRFGFFFRLETLLGTIIRLWLGVGNIKPGVNSLDLSSETYRTAGVLMDYPAFEQLVGFGSESVTFSLSGINQQVVDLAIEGAGELQGAQINTGFMLLGKDWQPVGSLYWVREYSAETVTIGSDPQNSLDQPIVSTVAVEASDQFATRRRGDHTQLTDQDQQTRSPGDNFLNRRRLYSPTWAQKWPPD